MSYINTLTPERIGAIQGVQNDIPVNVDELAKTLGVSILRTREVEGDGYLSYEDEQFTIHVNSTHSDNRQRFTIAHELSHFILHREYVEKEGDIDKGVRSGYVNQREAQADSLAAELLIPLDAIDSAIQRGINTLPRLADELKVSEEALKIRLNY